MTPSPIEKMTAESKYHDLEPLLERLEDCIKGDIEAQRNTLATLEAQRVAIEKEHIEGVELTTAEMVEQMRGMQERDQRRQQIVEAFARALGQSAESLTLSMVVQLAGSRADDLAQLRQELRNLSARVIRENRRLSALVGMRRRIVTDVIDSLLQGNDGSGETRPGGVLINAEA